MTKSTKVLINCFVFLIFISISKIEAQTEWTGPQITFTKSNYSDWNLEANQDRITSNVWITRQNRRLIYNIAQESEAQGGIGAAVISPVDTEWALGAISDGVGNLTFNTLANTLNGQVGNNILNSPMVLHLITDDIYIDINFTAWTPDNNGGGFSYIRSTESSLSLNNESNAEIQIYPNPVKNKFTISLLKNYSYRNAKIILFDSQGRVIKNFSINSQTNKIQISMSDLKSGLYFYKITIDRIKPFLGKIIKE